MMNLLSKVASIQKNLEEQILVPWLNILDLDQNVIHSSADREWNIDDSQELSCVLLARILWTYSRAYLRDKQQRWLNGATLAYKTLTDFFLDKEYGGYFWSTSVHGDIIDDRKHIYAQCFSLYGLSNVAVGNGIL